MKIPSDQIKTKEIAGYTKDKNPIVYIETHGGLHAFFGKNSNGDVEALGAAAHKAIAQFLASKKVDIKWEDNSEQHNKDLKKTEQTYFQYLRNAMFTAQSPESIDTEFYMVYSIPKETIQVMEKSELEESISNGSVDQWDMIRNTSLREPIRFVKDTSFKIEGK